MSDIRSVVTYTHVPQNDAPHSLQSGAAEFMWNNRTCKGSTLHVAALEGNAETIKAWLQGKPDQAVSERFTYETIFGGQVQEGSGEAVHIAASRGHVDAVKILLEAKASLDSMVTRDHKGHYDVLQAATFAEGRGGFAEMMKYLIVDEKAAMTKNSDGRYPLHIAFLTGNVPVIQLLREILTEQGVTDQDYQDPKVPFPLSLGISGGKMSEDQLGESAELTTLSLTTFIHECPQCVSAFLKRFQSIVSAHDLARQLTRLDIAMVLRESPESAMALLESATEEPECANRAWHPLPTRVSFATRDKMEKLQNLFNPPRVRFTFYENDCHWDFDSQRFVGPSWHSTLNDRSFGRPILDVETKVCHIPNLLCAEVFSSLCDSANDDSADLYNDPVIESMITHVFWNGCCRTELTWVMLTLWGLTLLVVEEWYVRYCAEMLAAQSMENFMQSNSTERRLARAGAGAGIGVGNLQDEGWPVIDVSIKPSNVWVSISWIASKALVDFVLEMVQLRGFKVLGRWHDYFAMDNLRDVMLSVLPMLLLFDLGYMPLMLLTVFLYWFRLLDCFAASEYIGNELLPIVNLAGGLMPAMCVTTVAFGAFTHSFYLVNGSNQALYPDVFLESFSILLTAGLPGDPSDVTPLKLLLIFGAVSYFSVFILNIFIGVIGEKYAAEKENVSFSFKKLRASSCFVFLLRCKILPCRLCSVYASYVALLAAGGLAVGTQIYCFCNHRYHYWVTPVFMICQGIIVLSSYQDPRSPWVLNAHGPEENHYMWFCKPPSAATEEQPQNECLAQEVKDIRESMDGMKDDMKSVMGQFEDVKLLLQELKNVGSTK